MDELSVEEMKDVLSMINNMKSAMMNSHSAEGFNISWNEGSAAGQRVMHLHVNVVPRKENDRKELGYEPRQFIYDSVESRKKIPEAKLQEIAAKIRGNL